MRVIKSIMRIMQVCKYPDYTTISIFVYMFVSMQILQLNNYAEFDLIAHGKKEKGGDSESMHLQVCNKQYLLFKPDPPHHHNQNISICEQRKYKTLFIKSKCLKLKYNPKQISI